MPAAIPMIVMIAGTAMSAAAAVQQGREQRKQAEHAAKVERFNATQAQYDAAINESIIDANEKSMYMDTEEQAARTLSARKEQFAGQLVRLSASGLDVGSTSLEDILSVESAFRSTQTRDLYHQAHRQASGMRAERRGVGSRAKQTFALGMYQSDQLRLAGRNAQSGANLRAAGTVIGGLGQTFG